jgi:hypothetical protein
MTQTFGILNFGHWDLFDIWDLLFGISKSQLVLTTDYD